MVKSLPAKQKTWVQSLDQEDLLEKAMATLSSVLAWRTLWTEEPGGAGLQSTESQGVEYDSVTDTDRYIHTSTLSWISLAFRSPQSTEQSSLCCTGGPYLCIFLKETKMKSGAIRKQRAELILGADRGVEAIFLESFYRALDSLNK